jgi:hypothetical protein
LPFLEYITDPDHKWKVCIGVPYGTHLWQPHDSSELNGTFKIKLYREKLLYLKNKPIGSSFSFCPTDIIPIVNRTWATTLGDKNKARKAITNRGWGPLTYNLLDHPIFHDLKDEVFNPFDLQTRKPVLDMDTINTGSETGCGDKLGASLDTVVTGRARSAAIKQRNTELVEQGMTQVEHMKMIQTMTSLHSGKLCAANSYCISREEYRDRLK